MNTTTKTNPTVSIVLATRNEEANIERCLKSIREQNYPFNHIEVTIVDNQSNDNTCKLAKKYTQRIFNLSDHVNIDKIKNKRGAQINFGVKKSTGEIIFFPDADMTFDKNLLREAVSILTSGNTQALYIPEVIIGKGLFGKVRRFERSFYNMTPIDGIRIINKDLFEKVQGFDEKYIAFGFDDWDITNKVKNESRYVSITKTVLYHHEETLDIATYLKKKGNYSNAAKGYIEKWGRGDSDVKKQFGFQYRYIRVFFENGKWNNILRYPLLSILMFMLKIAVGTQYIIGSKLNANEA